MAASDCRQEQTDVEVNPRFRRQQDRLDPTIDAMSSPYRVFRRRGARLATRVDPASGQPGHGRPIGGTIHGADARGGGPVPAAGAPACGTIRQRGSRRLGRCHLPFTPAGRPSGILLKFYRLSVAVMLPILALLDGE